MAREPSGHAHSHDVVGPLVKVVRSIDVLISEVQAVWASAMGLSVPQWNILVTIAEAQQQDGLSVKAVADALRVNPSFIVHQSRPLEDRGFIRRKTSSADKRYVYLTITPKALKELSHLAKSRGVVSAAIKKEMGEAATLHTIELLQQLERCLARCRLVVQINESGEDHPNERRSTIR
ncbi:MarR family winged helix-turn-helix transcriptional regulator [Bradyrhizobium liaoningense]